MIGKIKEFLLKRIEGLIEVEIENANRMIDEALELAEKVLENPKDRQSAFEIYERLVSFGRHSSPFIVDELTDWREKLSERYLITLLDGAKAVLPHNLLFAEYLHKGLLKNKTFKDVQSPLFQVELGKVIGLSLASQVIEEGEELFLKEREIEERLSEAGDELVEKVASMLEKKEITEKAVAGILHELEEVELSNTEALEKIIYNSTDKEVQKLAAEKLLESENNLNRIGIQGFHFLAEYLISYRNLEGLYVVSRASNQYGIFPKEETLLKIRALSEDIYKCFKFIPYERESKSPETPGIGGELSLT